MISVILANTILAIGLSSLLILINSLIAKKNILDREKPSPFECGFDPKRHSRLPFSLRFYLIAVIFLIFDVEITLIIPIPLITLSREFTILLIIASFFIIILIIGLYHEWKQGALNWK